MARRSRRLIASGINLRCATGSIGKRRQWWPPRNLPGAICCVSVFRHQAAQLAETIASEGKMGFRIAHKIVGRLVRNCIDRQIPPAGVQPEMVNQASIEVTGRSLHMRAHTLRRSMDVAFILRHRKTLGGPGRQQVLRMLKRRTSLLEREEEWNASHHAAITQARRMTDALGRRIMT